MYNNYMPITEELKNVRNFESVGFSHEQAETLAVVIEQSHAQSQESLKDFIRNELDKQTNDFDIKLGALDNKLSQRTSDLEINMTASHKELSQQINDLAVNMATLQKELSQQTSDLAVNIATSQKVLSQQTSDLAVNMATSQKDLLIKIFGIIVGTVGVAVTILKLF